MQPGPAHHHQQHPHHQQQHPHPQQQHAQAVAAPRQRTSTGGGELRAGPLPPPPPPPQPPVPPPQGPPAPASAAPPPPPPPQAPPAPRTSPHGQPPSAAVVQLHRQQQQQQQQQQQYQAQLQLQLYQQQQQAALLAQLQARHDPAAAAAACVQASARAPAPAQRQAGAPGPVQGGGAGGPRRPPQAAASDPRSLTMGELPARRDQAIEWLRGASAAGGFSIEAALWNVIHPALQAAYLPTDAESLTQLAPDMIPLSGCAPGHYLKAFALWQAWVVQHELPTFPIVGSFVALCLADTSHALLKTAADRHRTADILDLYRRVSAPAFANFAPRYPRERFTLARPWTDAEWANWAAYVEQSSWALGEWRAIQDLTRPAAANAANAAAPSPAVSPQLAAPPVSRAPSWQGQGAAASTQQQQHHHHAQQQQQQQRRRAPGHPHAAAAAPAVEQPHSDTMRRAWSSPQAQAQAHAHWRSLLQASPHAQLAPHPHPHPRPQPQPQPPVLYPPPARPALAERPSSASSSASASASSCPRPHSGGAGAGRLAAPGPLHAQTSSAPQSATVPVSGGSGGAAPTAQRALGPGAAPAPVAAAAPAPPPPPPSSTTPAPAPAPIAVAVPLPPPHFAAAASPAAAAPPPSGTSPNRRTAALATVDSWVAQLQAAEARNPDRVALIARLTGAGRAELDKVEERKGKGASTSAARRARGRGRAGKADGAGQQAGGEKEVERARGQETAQGDPSVVSPSVAAVPSTAPLPPPPSEPHADSPRAGAQGPPVLEPSGLKLDPQPPTLPPAPSPSSLRPAPSSTATSSQPDAPKLPAPAPSTSTPSAPPAPYPPTSASTSTSSAPHPTLPAPPAPPGRTAPAPTKGLRWVSMSGQRPGQGPPGPPPPLDSVPAPTATATAPLAPSQDAVHPPRHAVAPQPEQVGTPPPPPTAVGPPEQALALRAVQGLAPPPVVHPTQHMAAPESQVPAIMRYAQEQQDNGVEVGDEVQFWAAAAHAERSLAKCAQAAAAAALAAQAKAAREAELDVSLGDTDATLASIRASPWTSGAPTVVSPGLIMSVAGAPYGDYVPGPTKSAPALGTRNAPSSISRDPLNALKPLMWPPAPFVPTLAASPQSFPADLSTTVHLSAPPFTVYPAALDELTPQLAAKTWKYATDLSLHVDRLVATTAPHLSALAAPLQLADADALERARKRVLATMMHDSLVKSFMAPLPDVVEPAEARRMRKRVKKARHREKKARRAREAAEGAKKVPEVLELADSDDEGATGTGTAGPMDVDGVGASEVVGQGGEGPPVTVEDKQKVEHAPAKSPSAIPRVSALAPVADTSAPSAATPSASVAAPPTAPAAHSTDDSTPSTTDAASAAAPSTAAPASTSASLPPRPTLPGALSAPVVPGSRQRSDSQGAMRRRPSVSGPGIHPLAQLYATVPPSMRQMFRGKANELRGADPVALAVATARLTSPALRNEAVLAGSSARASPRVGGGAGTGGPALAVASPPLVPITLKPVGAGREGGGAAGPAKAEGASRAGPLEASGQPQEPATALGMSIETPAMSTVARETAPASNLAPAQERAPSPEKHDSPPPAPVEDSSPYVPLAQLAANVSAAPPVESTPTTAADEQPSPATKSVASSVASTLSAVARAAVDAVGSAAKALLPIDSSTSSPSASAPAPAPVAVPAAGPGVEAVAPTAPVAPAAAPTIATTKKPRSKPKASTASSSSSVVPAKRSAAPAEDEPEHKRRPHPHPHPLRTVPRAWLATSVPLMPFTHPIRRGRVRAAPSSAGPS
ncbi:uncharacterized protein RHOBADRAFT_50728 [Rhodotorula graminis WP1]|uniref:Uncharacterized protein n=1 Tax=Rhodotorula graminis (strain WP1) TaxID=578459 RepID=A0A194SCA7_RHOGW|nr:uncharacterized protein RHOBADRAFT_50728 [Rhodotorula graminis WP1]KPV78234.1 hypothetical protein RHOBADRAFT_50728 [Rhodotorula graminis WP1]